MPNARTSRVSRAYSFLLGPPLINFVHNLNHLVNRFLLEYAQPVPLEITQREMNGICVLTLKGRLVLGQESNGLRTTIDNPLLSSVTRIVIGLEQVNYVDSAGLGALIEIHRKTKAKGGLVGCYSSSFPLFWTYNEGEHSRTVRRPNFQ